jgi:hypothetical protein
MVGLVRLDRTSAGGTPCRVPKRTQPKTTTSEETKVDAYLRRLKNRRIVAVTVVVAAILIGIEHVTGALEGIVHNVRGLWSPTHDVTLFAECHVDMSVGVPSATGVLYELDLNPFPAENGGGGLRELSTGRANVSWPMNRNGQQPTRYRCDVIDYGSNYGYEPVTNVRLDLRLSFQHVVRDNEQQVHGGGIFLARSWPILIGKIDAGSTHPFRFYIANNRVDQFVKVDLPDHVSYEVLGTGDRVSVPLSHSQISTMYFEPFRE